MKKKILGILLIIIIVIIISALLNGYSMPNQTIEEITDVAFMNISYIKHGDESKQTDNYDVEKFINKYKNLKYEKVYESYGITEHEYFVCYNSSNEPILTVVEVGNQDKVFIVKGKFDINKDALGNLYKLKK